MCDKVFILNMRTLFFEVFMKRLIKLLLVIAWMFMIFSFSNQNGEQSTSTSDGVLDRLVSIFVDDEIDENEKEIIIDKYTGFIRKTAHFMIYFILGILVFSLLLEFKINHIVIITTFICMLYAASDEIHQSFIPGRSCEIRDVLIDTSGSFLSSCLCFLIYKKNIKKV